MESFDDVAMSLNASSGSVSPKDQPIPTLTSNTSVSEPAPGINQEVKQNTDKLLPLDTTQTRLPELFPQKENAPDADASQYDADQANKIPLFDEDEGGDEEPEVAKSFERSPPPIVTQRSRDDIDDKTSDDGISKMHKFSLYETSTRYYMVGMDLLEIRFRILKIDRTSDSDDLSISEDDTVYTKKEMNQLLDAVDDGNKSSGGLKFRCSTWGLLGFIRFTGPYYMLLITKRSQVAMVGGHYIYQIDGTELVPLFSSVAGKPKAEKNADEARFIAIMNNVDLTRSFYFSYSYDITHTLQHNISRDRQTLEKGQHEMMRSHEHNAMFVWNHHLLEPVVSLFKNAYDWCLPIIHGYVDQAALSVYGRLVYITLIARRSRFFAGARFLKRGANDLGYVANDVETEQIVSEMLTTSFHSPGPKLFTNPQYTSYVQHRGSIPLHWTQDNTGVSPKPNIELNLVDPFYTAAALHFNNLFERYGAPIYVLNLVKARERLPRESILLKEYTNAITYLNQFLPEDKKIIYKAWDMSRASKSRDQDVIGTLEAIAADIIPTTGFFHNGDYVGSGLRLQNGVARTNCIDCLDRTNAAQFVIGKRALGHQLHALGVINGTSIEYDTDAVNMFTNMWHHHGDTIAVQYGGSHLVNTMATYRKINQWTGHSRDMVESFKRYYNNSFLDAQRQEAHNLFLGNYIFSQDQPMLWELQTDYYLHHSNPREWSTLKKPSYINWYNPEFLKEREMVATTSPPELAKSPVSHFDDYWLEYYRPLAVSSFSKVFSFKMKSTLRYIPYRHVPGHYDPSPFVVRAVNEPDSRERKASRKKGVTLQEPSDDMSEDARSIASSRTDATSSITTSRPLLEWLQQSPVTTTEQAGSTLSPLRSLNHDHRLRFSGQTTRVPPILEGIEPFPTTTTNTSLATSFTAPSKAQMAQWSLGQLVTSSLNPSISSVEAEEYERYINHPLKVPLVVTSDDAIITADPTSSSSHGAADRVALGSGGGVGGIIDGSSSSNNPEFLEYTNYKVTLEEANLNALAEENLPDYLEFLNVSDEGLTVVGEDHDKKRYKRYRQWLRGKSLFKQRVDL
ncbi:hypothetical protein AJ80_02148 [Polytolypa hystricis UAMH7299]|uniref:SAC domain-containing protein n=1 Tax=Polytolypa hystricis (strain UAMH7299) TaxID=1447883 RepID=A0A2B7YRB7_POLH7|nr:hypothetical protein AJ80_02148 [Polytolypa hystricis UAMH7299]